MMSGTSSLPLSWSLLLILSPSTSRHTNTHASTYYHLAYFRKSLHASQNIPYKIFHEKIVIPLCGWKQLRLRGIELFLKLEIVFLETSYTGSQEPSHPSCVALSILWNLHQLQFPLWLERGKWMSSTMSFRHTLHIDVFPGAYVA